MSRKLRSGNHRAGDPSGGKNGRHADVDPELSKGLPSAMTPTEDVQEKNPRGIPKAPFIVSFETCQPWRAIG